MDQNFTYRFLDEFGTLDCEKDIVDSLSVGPQILIRRISQEQDELHTLVWK